jgi:hypothetical protein
MASHTPAEAPAAPTQGTLAALRAACELPVERLHKISADMQSEMLNGLAADGCQLKMLPSHVTRLPSGCDAFFSRGCVVSAPARAHLPLAPLRAVAACTGGSARACRLVCARGAAADADALALRQPRACCSCRVCGDSSERGEWYALDLGGTNFRVLRLTLSDVEGGIADVQARARGTAHAPSHFSCTPGRLTTPASRFLRPARPV